MPTLMYCPRHGRTHAGMACWHLLLNASWAWLDITDPDEMFPVCTWICSGCDAGAVDLLADNLRRACPGCILDARRLYDPTWRVRR
jgi:hypothetical protein